MVKNSEVRIIYLILLLTTPRTVVGMKVITQMLIRLSTPSIMLLLKGVLVPHLLEELNQKEKVQQNLLKEVLRRRTSSCFLSDPFS